MIIDFNEAIAIERRASLGRWWWLRPWNWSFERRRLRPGLTVVERQIQEAARLIQEYKEEYEKYKEADGKS